MPEAARNYSITELEVCRLAINIASFAHLLKRVDFDAVVDHLAITHIMESKMEPATNRIKRLLEVLSSYSFNLYYIKGKDMILSDFLSRQIEDESNLYEIIPISFNIWEILHVKTTTTWYQIPTRCKQELRQRPKRMHPSQWWISHLVAQKAAPKIVKLPSQNWKGKGY